MAIDPGSHLIAITGGKGGVGKSVFAANLAFALLETRMRVLLMDMDSQSCGDQNLIMGLDEPKTLSDLCNFNAGINETTIPSVVSIHPKGVGFVAAVRGREGSLTSKVDVAMKQVDSLSKTFRFIVIDIGTQLGPLQQAVIERATVLLSVTTPEMIAITQTQRAIEDLMSKSVPADMIQVVINKAGGPGALNNDVVAASFRGLKFIGAIPQDDVTANGAIRSKAPFMVLGPQTPIAKAHSDIARRLTGGVLQTLRAASRAQVKFKKEDPPAEAGDSGSRFRGGPTNVDARTSLKLSIHNELVKDVELSKKITDTQGDPEKEKALRAKTQAVIAKIFDDQSAGVGRDERAQIIDEVLNEALGLGPLEALLADPDVTEIMVNGYRQIYVEKKGIIQQSPVKFTSNFHLRKVIERIVTPLGRQINESSPYVDARLRDGSRVNAVIEPLAIDGPAVTIRKFSKKSVTPETYVNTFGAATANMMEFLKIAVQAHRNIIISGGTGSGKTTLLNTMSGFIPSNERIVTIEDAAELQLKQDHVVRLETKPANMEGKGQVSIRDLVKNSLRMRPDRIVVGECRDGAALDMLSAMGTGHDGSMTTLHANSPREAIGRLETLCLMAGMDLPVKAIREQIAGSVHIIVQISRLSDGTRKLISIQEVQGMQGEVVTLQPVFTFVEKDLDKNRKIVGQFQASGHTPKFVEKLARKGISIPPGLFTNEVIPMSGSAAPKPAAVGSVPPKPPGSPGAPGANAAAGNTVTANSALNMQKKVVGGK